MILIFITESYEELSRHWILWHNSCTLSVESVVGQVLPGLGWHKSGTKVWRLRACLVSSERLQGCGTFPQKKWKLARLAHVTLAFGCFQCMVVVPFTDHTYSVESNCEASLQHEWSIMVSLCTSCCCFKAKVRNCSRTTACMCDTSEISMAQNN